MGSSASTFAILSVSVYSAIFSISFLLLILAACSLISALASTWNGLIAASVYNLLCQLYACIYQSVLVRHIVARKWFGSALTLSYIYLLSSIISAGITIASVVSAVEAKSSLQRAHVAYFIFSAEYILISITVQNWLWFRFRRWIIEEGKKEKELFESLTAVSALAALDSLVGITEDSTSVSASIGGGIGGGGGRSKSGSRQPSPIKPCSAFTFDEYDQVRYANISWSSSTAPPSSANPSPTTNLKRQFYVDSSKIPAYPQLK